MISVSTHILDLATGKPVAGIATKIEHVVDHTWVAASDGVTDSDGRIPELASGLSPGHYRLRFATGDIGTGFFPEVSVTCNLDGSQDHYHIPLLLSPYGYSTYRGS